MKNGFKSRFNIELHLKSTLSELSLNLAQCESAVKATVVRKILEDNASTQGVIITTDGKFNNVITRKAFFEILSKPFGLELFSERPVDFLLENMTSEPTLFLPASMTIVEAMNRFIERPVINLEDPIIVEFENGDYKILDSKQLIFAYSHINTLALKAVKEANEFKTELLGIAAHDLKNPLNNIIGLTNLILQSGEFTNPEIIDLVGQIQDVSTHMHGLILELLNTSVIESGRMEIRKQDFEFSEMVSAIVFQIKSQVDRKRQTLNFKYDFDANYYVQGDSLKLREAAENLISNAVKYSPEDATINVIIHSDGEYVTLKVQDEGPGLTDGDKEKLFGKFQRLSASPTGGESSTGLGLYIAKQIIELHEGEIWVESVYGEGSSFFIKLPCLVFDFDDE